MRMSEKRTIPRHKENPPPDSSCLSENAVQESSRLIGYARVSTTDQHLNLQQDALTRAGCSQVYADEGVSGTVNVRPQLTRALKSLQAGDTLVVWRLDRLGRSLSQLIATIDELGRRGCHFKSITEAIDTTTAGGTLILHIMGALAQFERTLIVERTNAGLTAAKRRGVRLGRKPSLNQEQIQHARQLLETEGGRAVARTLGVSRSTLYASLSR
jgi:DNA invertase Pin-like site-specific DNA recombinase